MPFSSKDFDRTGPKLVAQGASHLLHEAVLESGMRAGFSKERGHGVAVVNLPSKTISMTIGHLTPGQSTRRHRHNYETILYVTQGEGYTLVDDEKVPWSKGDAVYVPVWSWHQHVNTGEAEAVYVACENAPLLQNIGGIALREEAP